MVVVMVGKGGSDGSSGRLCTCSDGIVIMDAI